MTQGRRDAGTQGRRDAGTQKRRAVGTQFACAMMGAMLAFVCWPSLAEAQTANQYTKSHLLQQRGGHFDAAWGHYCIAGEDALGTGNSSTTYDERFGWGDASGDFHAPLSPLPGNQDCAVGYGGRIYAIENGGLSVVIGDTLVRLLDLPEQGEVLNTVVADQLRDLSPGFSDGAVSILMDTGNVWTVDLREGETPSWVLRSQGYGGSIVWITNHFVTRMHLILVRQQNDGSYRAFEDRRLNVYGPNFPQPTLPVSADPVFEPVGGHDGELAIGYGSYIGAGSTGKLYYPNSHQDVYPNPDTGWGTLLDYDEMASTGFAVDHFPLDFADDEEEAGEWLSGYRGFDDFGGLTPQSDPRPDAILGFLRTNFGRFRVIAVRRPALAPLPQEAPAWLKRDLQLSFWRPANQVLPATYSQSELIFGWDGATPQLVEDDPLGGPVYEVPVGWSEIPARPLDTHRLPSEIGELLAVDVFLPESESWAGTIQFSGDVVAAGVSDTYFGHVDLDTLPREQWVTVHVGIPTPVLNALRENHPRAQVRTFVNTGVGGVRVRGLRAEGSTDDIVRPPYSEPSFAHQASSALFGFENAADWTGNRLEIQSQHSLSGTAAKLNASGWTELLSREFTSAEVDASGDELVVHLRAFEALPNPYWAGTLAAYISCPSSGLWHEWVGQKELTTLYLKAWNEVRLQLPQQVQEVLSGPFSDCSLRFALNVHSGSGPFVLDELYFAE